MGVLFPHHLGHYVGLDVHDCSGYSRGQNLKAGQCITVEPYVVSPLSAENSTNITLPEAYMFRMMSGGLKSSVASEFVSRTAFVLGTIAPSCSQPKQ